MEAKGTQADEYFVGEYQTCERLVLCPYVLVRSNSGVTAERCDLASSLSVFPLTSDRKEGRWRLASIEGHRGSRGCPRQICPYESAMAAPATGHGVAMNLVAIAPFGCNPGGSLVIPHNRISPLILSQMPGCDCDVTETNCSGCIIHSSTMHKAFLVRLVKKAHLRAMKISLNSSDDT